MLRCGPLSIVYTVRTQWLAADHQTFPDRVPQLSAVGGVAERWPAMTWHGMWGPRPCGQKANDTKSYIEEIRPSEAAVAAI